MILIATTNSFCPIIVLHALCYLGHLALALNHMGITCQRFTNPKARFLELLSIHDPS